MNRPERAEHRMERTYEVAATPEDVWDAIATADGIAAWMVPTRLDPQTGGAVSFDVGFWSHGIVTDYSPTRRFAYAEPWPIADHMPTAHHDLSSLSPIATEFLVESTSGGSCMIRVVSSAYGTGADWENEFFAEMAEGWGALLDNLAAYLGQGRHR
ncbi:MAG: SRPBCC domain-containing protein [Acidimicrobiales bacterium]